jgi:aspartyl-tRNA(Asn)/glutamyl-tRNA(Gln) amidotransferase subunit C
MFLMSPEITKKDIEDIAKLSRIEVSESEKDKMVESFGPIMEMIDQINSVEIGGEVQRNFRLKNITRKDEVRENSSENKKEIIKNFPETKDNYLKTKKIL